MTTKTIEVPEELYIQLEQRAHAIAQSVDESVIRALASSLPPAFDPELPQTVQNELAAMESLSDAALWTIARSAMKRDSLAFYYPRLLNCRPCNEQKGGQLSAPDPETTEPYSSLLHCKPPDCKV